MKKILFILVMIMSVFVVNAQTAIESQKALDNTYIGIEGGAFTPMSFNSVFPLNGTAGIKLGKNFTPVYGINIEGTSWFGSASDNQSRFSYKNVVRATTVGMNLTMDVTNFSYNPNRKFHVILENGIGWLHAFNSNTSDYNDLYIKNSVLFAWTPTQSWSFYAGPAIYWNVSKDGPIQFNKNHSQLGINIGVNYHFKTSNGTHSFKKYDIGAMNEEINALRAENQELINRKPEVVTKTIYKERIITETKYVPSTYVIFFAQGSAELNDYSILDSIPTDVVVDIKATASPEGAIKFNQKLSEQRAKIVSNYLTKRGIKVNSCKGLGVTGNTSNRVAIVTITD